MLISIVINNYNYGRFVSQAIESALAQTYPQTQVIVVDDGSTDESLKRIGTYSDRIVLVTKANGGQASALNAGFARANGDYFIFLDADDFLAPDALARVATKAEESAAKIHWRMRVVDAEGKPVGWMPKRKWRLAEGDVAIAQATRSVVSSPTSGNAFSRAFLTAVMPVPEELFRINADVYLLSRSPFFGKVIAIDEPLSFYRVHSGSSKRRPKLERQLRNLRQAVFVRKLMAKDAARVGISICEESMFWNYAMLEARLTSLACDLNNHPIANDSPGRILRRGLENLVRAEWDLWPRRTFEFARLLGATMLFYVRRGAVRDFGSRPRSAPGVATWISCQLGAREHYAVPRALHRRGLLDVLLTDAWLRPNNPLGRLQTSFRERFHGNLSDATVRRWNIGMLWFEVAARARLLKGWALTIERNRWFQAKVVSYLTIHESHSIGQERVLFSGSYIALDPFRLAKRCGWRTMLGQIDCGVVEEDIVAKEAARVPDVAAGWERAPTEYWTAWREECELADEIIVNSQWAREALAAAGISAEKLRIVPLAYEPPASNSMASREYPSRFTPDRPLRVLFLGQINVRKGAARVFEAIAMLGGEPIEFQFVGPVQVRVPQNLAKHRVHWIGPVARSKTAHFYRNADVLLFPTLSDGFGLTQLEAMAHKLPVIASRYCGEVVRHQQNGILLDEPRADAIADVLRFCLADPQQLSRYSQCAEVEERFTISQVGAQLASTG